MQNAACSIQHAADRGLKHNGNNTYNGILLNVLLLIMILDLPVCISHITRIINKATAHAYTHASTYTLVRETSGDFHLLLAGLLAVDIKTGRPSHHRLVFLIFGFVQANVKMAAKIPSCHCTFLVQPSMFKFTKINPLALE